MEPDEVRRMMKKAEDYHAGRVAKPEEIVRIENLIQKKIENLALLTQRFGGIVDQSAVDEIVQLRLQKDAAWARFGLE